MLQRGLDRIIEISQFLVNEKGRQQAYFCRSGKLDRGIDPYQLAAIFYWYQSEAFSFHV